MSIVKRLLFWGAALIPGRYVQDAGLGDFSKAKLKSALSLGKYVQHADLAKMSESELENALILGKVAQEAASARCPTMISRPH